MELKQVNQQNPGNERVWMTRNSLNGYTNAYALENLKIGPSKKLASFSDFYSTVNIKTRFFFERDEDNKPSMKYDLFKDFMCNNADKTFFYIKEIEDYSNCSWIKFQLMNKDAKTIYYDILEYHINFLDYGDIDLGLYNACERMNEAFYEKQFWQKVDKTKPTSQSKHELRIATEKYVNLRNALNTIMNDNNRRELEYYRYLVNIGITHSDIISLKKQTDTLF